MTPRGYVMILVACLFGAYAYKLYSEDVFACPAEGYSESRYLAYCNATAYGDYDHGAFWFGLEPRARRAAGSAEVVFLGNSRMQFGFSTDATRRWFGELDRDFYLLGFSHSENVGFVAPLLHRMPLRPRALVVNIDQYFDDRVTAPAADIRQRADIGERYARKRLWQAPHRLVCGTLPLLCGDALSFYRSRDDGTWVLNGDRDLQGSGTALAPALERERWPEYVERGREFLAQLPVPRECILFTIVPSGETRIDEARAVAEALGIRLVTPEWRALRTFDGSHLEPPSAERWSAAFFEHAGEDLRRCLG